MAMSQSQTHLNRNCWNYLKSLSLKTGTVVDVSQQNWTFFAKTQKRCKQRWTGNPMGIVGNLNLSVMFTCAETLPKRSDPSTPYVNCFHFVREKEGCWDVFFFFSSRFIIENATTATPCLYTCSHETLNTQIHRQSAVREWETVATFKFPTTDIWDMTRRSFRQLSLFVIWRPGFLETSVEFISCACWGNTKVLSSLKEVKREGITEPHCLTPCVLLKSTWKIQNLSYGQGVYDQVRIIHLS